MTAERITYILAEDEAVHSRFTREELDKIPGLVCLKICVNAMETRGALLEQQPDLLVLDIEMPGLNGIELARSLKKPPFTLFITAHPQYAADAFELDAVDYLVKPVRPARLLRAVDKIKMLMGMQAMMGGDDAFRLHDDASFFIREKNVFVKIHYQEVLYAESLGNFVTIFLDNGQKKIALVSLKNLELQLPAQVFMRISRTHIVNKKKITAVDRQAVHLQNIQLPVGKAHSDAVLAGIVGHQAVKRFL